MFYGDVYGSFGPRRAVGRAEGTLELPPHHAAVVRMVLARRLFAYGTQTEYFADDRLCVGFTRRGRLGGGPGLAVLMSAVACGCEGEYLGSEAGAWCKSNIKTKRMYVGAEHAGERWTDILGASQEGGKGGPGYGCEHDNGTAVVIDELGWATFSVGPRRVSIWVDEAAEGRDVLDVFKL